MDLTLKGNWNIIQGKLKAKYGELTDDDLVMVKGEEDQMIGRLQKRLGKTKDEIVRELSSLIEVK
ncbi:CsbD family protein [Ekhidna sp.]